MIEADDAYHSINNSKTNRIMEKQVFGMTANIKKVISEKSMKCLHCMKETKDCVKLYKRAGSNVTMCVELE